MKLLNYTSVYFSVALLIVISIWAAAFYYTMLIEIYDSIDDGLDNQKGLVIQKAATDTSLLNKNNFDESDYTINEIPAGAALNLRDAYIDTMMFMQNEKSDEPVRLLKTVFLQNGKYYELKVATSMVEEDDLVKQMFFSLFWLYFGLVLFVIIFNNFLFKKIWQPFYQLLKHLKKFRLDKPEPVAPIKTKVDEFNMLNETVQKFVQRNIDTYTSQKHFIENASHELQTPLAISINKLESLAEDEQLKPDQLKLVASALDHLERLTRLNKSLLLLSRIENKQFAEASAVNITELTKKITADFSDQLTFSGLKLTITEKNSCIQKMNSDLAAILLINLVKNAIIHNKAGGFITITIDSDSLMIENSGVGKPLNQEKIFSRFHSDEPSSVSTGLGLAIVKAIGDLYNFKTSYRYEQKHIITVQF
ncbi:MAG TPA: HAMP domain-containing sensor histidine kinase [Chitinophagaceae bacterium]|nr:HAMP domain-containing sensor histidine kinase [Chitinophagaceae bacterium]